MTVMDYAKQIRKLVSKVESYRELESALEVDLAECLNDPDYRATQTALCRAHRKAIESLEALEDYVYDKLGSDDWEFSTFDEEEDRLSEVVDLDEIYARR